jgi:hypothetical protein
VESTILITRTTSLLATCTETVRMITRRWWRGCTAWERVESCQVILRKIVWGNIGSIARDMLLLHLVRLVLGIEHHLLISPLSELGIGSGIKVRILLGYLTWSCVW